MVCVGEAWACGCLLSGWSARGSGCSGASLQCRAGLWQLGQGQVKMDSSEQVPPLAPALGVRRNPLSYCVQEEVVVRQGLLWCECVGPRAPPFCSVTWARHRTFHAVVPT